MPNWMIRGPVSVAPDGPPFSLGRWTGKPGSGIGFGWARTRPVAVNNVRTDRRTRIIDGPPAARPPRYKTLAYPSLFHRSNGEQAGPGLIPSLPDRPVGAPAPIVTTAPVGTGADPAH